MDPLRIAVRVAFSYLFALAIVRISGKRTIKQGDLPSFVLAVIVGDLFDDAFWAETPMAAFVVASATLVVSHVLVTIDAFHRGSRIWRRQSRREGLA